MWGCAPRIAAAAIGLVALGAGLSACSTETLKQARAEKIRKSRLYEPLRRADPADAYRGRRAARSGRRRSAATFCGDSTLPDCLGADPGALQAHASAASFSGTLQAYALAKPVHGTADRGCLVPAARLLLARLELEFGPVRVISTCRRGAVIAGTRRPSMHRYGKAIDFIAPAGRKAAVVRWLREHSPGVTMTYTGMEHIHTDVGDYRRVILGAGQRRRARSAGITSSQVTPSHAVW